MLIVLPNQITRVRLQACYPCVRLHSFSAVTLSFPVLGTARGQRPYQYTGGFFFFIAHPNRFGPTVSLPTIIIESWLTFTSRTIQSFTHCTYVRYFHKKTITPSGKMGNSLTSYSFKPNVYCNTTITKNWFLFFNLKVKIWKLVA